MSRRAQCLSHGGIGYYVIVHSLPLVSGASSNGDVMPAIQRACMVNYGHESVFRRCSVDCIGRKIQPLREWDVYIILSPVWIESAELDDKNLRGSSNLQALYELGCR